MQNWNITNCQSVGNLHQICQDHTAYSITDRVCVGALADGLSSDPHSDRGAQLVTKAACQELCDHFKEYYDEKRTAEDFVRAMQDAVTAGAAGAGWPAMQMRSTLLVCALSGDQCLLGQIGDGAILMFGRDSRVVSGPQENEMGGTATYTIMDPNAAEHFVFRRCGLTDCDGFLLTSDGLLGNVYYSGAGKEIPQLAYELFGALWENGGEADYAQRCESYRSYLAEYIQKGNAFADDCSLVMLSRTEPTHWVDYGRANGFEADVEWPCICGQTNRLEEIRCASCRRFYTQVYPDSVVDIHSKESFFSRLNRWALERDTVPFDPGDTAEVTNRKMFTALCALVKKNTQAKLPKPAAPAAPAAPEPPEQEEAAPPAEEAPSAPENAPEPPASAAPRPEPPKAAPAAKPEEKPAEKSARRVNIKPGRTPAESKVKKHYQPPHKKGLLGLSRLFPGKKADEREEDAAQLWELDRDELAWMAYRDVRIPMELMGRRKEGRPDPEFWQITQAIFEHQGAVHLTTLEGEESGTVQHYYASGAGLAVLHDDGGSALGCRLCRAAEEASLFLSDKTLVPRGIFGVNTADVQEATEPVAVDWKWQNVFFNSAGDANEMLRSLSGAVDRSPQAAKLALCNTERALWAVTVSADNRWSLAAYCLAGEELYRVLSGGEHQVLIQRVDPDDRAVMELCRQTLNSEQKPEKV